MEPTDLRSAEPDDLDAIRRLLNRCRLPSRDLTADRLSHFFVLEQAGKLIGTVGLENRAPYGLLRSLAVEKRSRGNGLGIRLVRQLEDHARGLGLETLYLLTTTAEPFFRERGYRVTGRERAPEEIRTTEEFSNICGKSATLMRKHL